MPLSEDNKNLLIDSLTGQVDVDIFRDWPENYKKHEFVTVGFNPTDQRFIHGLGNYLGSYEDNTQYSYYGYSEHEQVVIRSYDKDDGRHDARKSAQERITTLERFIKKEWNSYINSGSVLPYTFGHTEITIPFVRNLRGYEVTFDLVAPNTWNDIPESPERQPIVSGLSIESSDAEDVDDVDVWVV